MGQNEVVNGIGDKEGVEKDKGKGEDVLVLKAQKTVSGQKQDRQTWCIGK